VKSCFQAISHLWVEYGDDGRELTGTRFWFRSGKKYRKILAGPKSDQIDAEMKIHHKIRM
jgi:hypothetical protein